jgi:hypothetical protein
MKPGHPVKAVRLRIALLLALPRQLYSSPPSIKTAASWCLRRFEHIGTLINGLGNAA